MFYSMSTDSTVVSSDLISQPISFSNVNTKGEAEPLAVSRAHLLPQMHNWLPRKEEGKDKQQEIILTPVNLNWNPLPINRYYKGLRRDGALLHSTFLHEAPINECKYIFGVELNEKQIICATKWNSLCILFINFKISTKIVISFFSSKNIKMFYFLQSGIF